MTSCTRRRFLSRTGRYAAAALIANGRPQAIRATPLGKPVGIQLYTVKEEIGRDPAGTLRQLRRIGFGEVETAGFGQLSAGQFRRLLDEAGLACASAHLQLDMRNLDSAFADAHALGAQYAASGSLRSLAADPKSPSGVPQAGMSADEAKRGAELGRGVVDYGPILAAAEKAGLRHYFFEQEGPFHVAPMQAAQVAYDYLRAIR